jgi:hypothetical protein
MQPSPVAETSRPAIPPASWRSSRSFQAGTYRQRRRQRTLKRRIRASNVEPNLSSGLRPAPCQTDTLSDKGYLDCPAPNLRLVVDNSKASPPERLEDYY